MGTILRSFLPGSPGKTMDDDYDDDDYNVEYSIAMEYTGPPVSHDIPMVAPVQVHRVPTAEMAARAVLLLGDLDLPVVQPIDRKSDKAKKGLPRELKSGREGTIRHIRTIGDREVETFSQSQAASALRMVGRDDSESHVLDRAQSFSSSGTMGFSDAYDNSYPLSGSSDVEDFEDENKANVSSADSPNPAASNSNEVVEECVDEASRQGQRASVASGSGDYLSEECNAGVLNRPVVPDDGRIGLCHKCEKRSRFAEREVCIVCGAKYCRKCVLRAMGSMPEGRKCITCIGYRIDELKRGSLGKCSRMLKSLLTHEAVQQIMSSERSCEVNQLHPHLIFVNDKPLSLKELFTLQACPNPPKKLGPGRYWYDKVAGFWGKDGEKPCQIISAELDVGDPIKQYASGGNTNVKINNREITGAELNMLKACKIPCEGNPHFWVAADGSYMLEGMKQDMGNLWGKKRTRLVCAALSLPYPSYGANTGRQDANKDADKVNSKNLEHKAITKLLLIGGDESSTCTLFKQARILYDVPFSDDEKKDLKTMIQRNLYRYIATLVDGREQFEEEHAVQMRRLSGDESGPSENSDLMDDQKVYAFSPRLEAFSRELLQAMMTGSLEAIFPAATREYSPLVEELWKNKSFQAIYRRRNELPMLPRVAGHFLERAVDISRVDYEPLEKDILCAEGISCSNGIASMNFSFPRWSTQDGFMESVHNDPSISYQLITVGKSILNCKFLQMFEDVDLVIFCVSLTDYDEYDEDINGARTNKMLAAKKHFESIATDPTLCERNFLLILDNFDHLDEKIKCVPLTQCEWFQDFNPVRSYHPRSNTSNNASQAQQAFHYIAVKFKRLFSSLTQRKLFVSRVTRLDAESVDAAFRFGKEILKWDSERRLFGLNEWSSESIEPSTYELTDTRGMPMN